MISCYCWRSGLIEFGKKIPNGAIEICYGPEKKLKRIVSVCARHSRYGKSLIVPGIPEAESGRKALQALDFFKKMISRRIGDET